MKKTHTRRIFIKATGAGAVLSLAHFGQAGAAGPTESAAANRSPDRANGNAKFQLGLASYTFREFDLDKTLTMTKRVDLQNITLKSMHLPLNSSAEDINETLSKIKKTGLRLYGGGVIYMQTVDEVNGAFEYAKQAGMKMIIGVPNHDLLALVEQKVKEYDIKLAIHNHGPGDKVYPTPQSAYEKVRGMDKRMGLCIDVGHAMRSGIDPSDAARECADRLHDVHLKNVSEATDKGQTVEIGRGVIDIPKFLRTLIDIGYSGVASFEHEKDGKDPLPGLAESVGYVRGVLDSL